MTIQEQIDALEQSVEDLTSSPSGVLNYVGDYTIEGYDDTWRITMSNFSDRIDDLVDSIVEASGAIRIINNGLLFHRH